MVPFFLAAGQRKLEKRRANVLPKVPPVNTNRERLAGCAVSNWPKAMLYTQAQIASDRIPFAYADSGKTQVFARPVGRAAGRGTGRQRALALSLEPSRIGSAHHQFWGRQYQLEDRSTRPARRLEEIGSMDQGQRRRHRQHRAKRVCHVVYRKAAG